MQLFLAVVCVWTVATAPCIPEKIKGIKKEDQSQSFE
jgi:hypothetical protein